MKQRVGFSVLVLAAFFLASAAPAVTEEWKGTSPKERFSVGVLGGAALLDGAVGFGLLGAAAAKILDRGFIGGDINDQVYIEIQLGPEFYSGTTPAALGAHLRWDFHKNEDLWLYALGGVSSRIGGTVPIGQSNVRVTPHFGIGLVWETTVGFGVRVEVTDNFMGAGILVSL